MDPRIFQDLIERLAANQAEIDEMQRKMIEQAGVTQKTIEAEDVALRRLIRPYPSIEGGPPG